MNLTGWNKKAWVQLSLQTTPALIIGFIALLIEWMLPGVKKKAITI